MQRIAVPTIGGMVSSTLLTLIVIPAIYALVKGWRLPRGVAAASGNGIAAEPDGFGVAANQESCGHA